MPKKNQKITISRFCSNSRFCFLKLPLCRWQEHCCQCKLDCLQAFRVDSSAAGQVEHFRNKVKSLSTVDRSKFFFNLVKQMAVQADGSIGKIGKYNFLGHSVCFNAFQLLTGASRNFLRRLSSAVLSGAREAPVDGRSTRQHRNRPAERSVDSFFAFLHQYVAEPLAEGALLSGPEEVDGEIEVDLEDVLADNDTCEMDDYSQWIKGHPVAAIEQAGEDQKWINHCRLSDLYMQYKFNFTPSAELEDPAGTAIFYKVWREKWRGFIRIRRASQHSRCAECVKYCVYRQKAKTEEERNAIQEAYNAHLAQVFADREQGRRLAYMSEMSCRINSSIPPSRRILYLQVDGMDQARCSIFSQKKTPKNGNYFAVPDCFAALFFGQAKFKCPRFGPTLRSKLEEKLWRPTLHNVGIILFGLSEMYYLADCVDKKDSNNQATVLSILPANSSPMHLMYLLVDPKMISQYTCFNSCPVCSMRYGIGESFGNVAGEGIKLTAAYCHPK